MTLSRRDFVKVSGQLVSCAALAPVFSGLRLFSATAAEPAARDHLFVLVRTFGGMDVTLGLDPWVLPPGADDKDMFLEYRPEDIIKAGNLQLGPAAKALVPWASECLILNGVMMRRDAGHDVINQYMVTGRGDGKAAALPVELGLALGAGSFGILSNSGTYVAGKAVTLSATQEILEESDQSLLIAWIEERLKELASIEGTPLEMAEKKLVEGKEAAVRIQELLDSFKKETGGKLEDRHVLASVFAAGGAQQAQIDLAIPGLGLDTHSQHEKNHLQVQSRVWDQVAELFTLFKKVPYLGASLFDHTTFMVISEWSRTPFLNAAKGKDHNPFTNSVLFAGKGLQKGSVVGKSRLITRKQTGRMAEHIAWPFNYSTGQLATSPEGASFFYPENVIQTIGKLFGAPKAFHPVAASVPVIPGLLRQG